MFPSNNILRFYRLTIPCSYAILQAVDSSIPRLTSEISQDLKPEPKIP